MQFQTVSKASYQAKITEDGKNLEFETEELATELGKIRLPDDMRKHVEPGDVVSSKHLTFQQKNRDFFFKVFFSEIFQKILNFANIFKYQ